MMKICLIAPPTVRIRYNISGVYPMPPLGLAYIASVLEKDGFGVEIFDMPALRAGIPQVLDYLNKRDFSVYGISCNIFNLKYAISIASLIKARDKKAVVAVGGRCNALPAESIFKYGKDLDIIVSAEGEKAVLDLCKSVAENGNLDGAAGIRGISYKNNGRVIKNEDAQFVDLDKIPFPARHLLPNKLYRMHPPFGIYHPLTIMETSRGCVYNCNFCCLSAPVRQRSVSGIIAEIKELKNKYGIREIHFVDPNFTYNQGRIADLCSQLIKGGVKMRWTCKTRVDLVSGGLLKDMAKSGCYMISYGVESGGQEVLGIQNKEIGVNDTHKAFEWTHKAGIRSLAYAIIGYPGESDSDIKKTKRLMRKISPDFVLYNEFLMLPGSPVANRYLFENKLNYDGLIEFYFKENSSDVSRTRFSKHLKEANKSFYFRAGYILSRLIKNKGPRDLMNMARGLFYLILDKIRMRRIF